MSFRTNDVVLFSEGKDDSVWLKGYITGNNFAMCNCSDYFDPPVYYIKVISVYNGDDVTFDEKEQYTILAESKYILPYKNGYAWCIGQNCKKCEPYDIYNTEHISSTKDDLFELHAHNVRDLNMFDVVIVKANDKYTIDFFVSYNDDNTITTMYNGVVNEWYSYSEYKKSQNNEYTIKCGGANTVSMNGAPIEIPETKIICPCDNNEMLKEILETLKIIQNLLSFRGADDPYAPYGPMKIWYSTDKTIPDMNKGWRYQPGPYCGDLTGCKHNNYNYYTTATNKID